jgi:hypothetical protein
VSFVTSPESLAASLTELWSPRVVAEVDDAYVKVAKVHGSINSTRTLARAAIREAVRDVPV